MHLARHSIAPTQPIQVLDARFDADAKIFTAATPDGFAVYRSWPLELLRKREYTSSGTLTTVLPLHTSNLLFLVGGGASPLHPPNKVVVWDDRARREVAALEFRERVRGLAVRRGMLVVALRRRAVAFKLNSGGKTGLSEDEDEDIDEEPETGGRRPAIERTMEWDTCDNQRGLLAIATAPNATLLAIAGRQTGHVQLIHLPPCPLPPPPAPGFESDIPSAPSASSPPGPSRTTLRDSIHAAHVHTKAKAKAKAPSTRVAFIAAHESALAAIAVLPDGSLLATASARGTLVRVWDAQEGRLVRELRRGADRAEIYGLAFRPDGRDLAAWSDKGTVHVFSLESGTDAKGKGKGRASGNLQSSLAPLKDYVKLPSYFGSEWSYAQYRIPAQRSHIALSAASQAAQAASSSSSGGDASGYTGATMSARLADVAADERCVVAWIRAPPSAPSDEYQLVALTYSGGWYRIGLPSSSEASTAAPVGGMGGVTAAGSSASTIAGGGPTSPRKPARPLTPSLTPSAYAARTIPRPRSVSGITMPASARSRLAEREERERGMDKEKEKSSRACVLLEFRRFGRWDGWG